MPNLIKFTNFFKNFPLNLHLFYNIINIKWEIQNRVIIIVIKNLVLLTHQEFTVKKVVILTMILCKINLNLQSLNK
jgi:hypothetical protein